MSYCNIPFITNECNTTNIEHTTCQKILEENESNDSCSNNNNTSNSRSQLATTTERPRTLSHPVEWSSEHHDDLNPSSTASKSKEVDITCNTTSTSLLSKAKSTSTSTINSQQAYSFVEKLDYDLVDDTLLSILDSNVLEFKEVPTDSTKLHELNQQDTLRSEREEQEDHIEDNVPIYKLRADPDNPSESCEWIKAPHCFDEQQISELTDEQIKFTLDYFVLGGYRVSQMTKTYNDIEAVTKLLDEKEKDLELAATIGQQLLEKNQQLDSKIEFLEKELEETVENVNQLRHEIVLKDNLLKTFMESENESSLESQHFDAQSTIHTERSNVNAETLNEYKKRIVSLEDENDALRDKAEYFERQTAELENKKQILINSTNRELEHTRSTLKDTQEELKLKTSEYQSQQDEIQKLYTQLIELQYRVKLLTKDNTDLQFIYDSSTSSLMNQINELKEKYNDCLSLLAKTQDELLVLKNKLNLKRQSTLSGANFQPVNGAMSISGEENRPTFAIDVDSSEFNSNMVYFNKTSPSWTTQNSLATEMLLCNNNNRNSEITDQACKTSKFLKSVKRRVARQIPGTPFDSQQSDSEIDALNSEHDGRFENSHFRPLSFNSSSSNMQSSFVKFPNCRTPDSIFSTGSASIFGRSNSYLLPEKLQIVKPIEGSQTLQHWQHLATPNLGCLFENRPGISIRESSFNLNELKKEKKSKNFDCAIDEEDDFGVYDDEDEDELDFHNYSDDYFNSSFADEMMMSKKSSEPNMDDLFTDADANLSGLKSRNKILFSPSKVELLSKLLEKDEESREARFNPNAQDDGEQNDLTKSNSLLGLIKSASAKYLGLDGASNMDMDKSNDSYLIVQSDESQRTKRTNNKKHMHDDPDTPPSSPIHFAAQPSGSNLLLDYFESAKLKCKSALIEPLSSYFQQHQETTSTPPGTPTVEEVEYNEELNQYENNSVKSETKNFFDQIVSKLSLFSFKSVSNQPASTPTTAPKPTDPSFIFKPSPVYANTIESSQTETNSNKLNQFRLDNSSESAEPQPVPVPPTEPSAASEQPETPPCSPTPSDPCDDYDEEDMKKSAFVRVARLNPYINKSVDLASLLGSLSSLKRNQRLCKYY